MPQSSRQDLSPFDILTTYTPSNATDKPGELGATGATPDGRTFKLGYLAVGATTLVPSKLNQGPAVTANVQGATVSAQSIGDTTITLTISASTISANTFAYGYIGIISGTGIGQVLQIKSHPAIANATSLTLTLADPIAIATANTATANVWAHNYNNPVVFPTAATGSAIGMTLVSLAADATYGTYGWFQTGGICLYLNDATTSAGLGLKPSTNTAGALMTVDATGSQMATSLQTVLGTNYGFCHLNIFS